jgi:adenylate cyclase class 2
MAARKHEVEIKFAITDIQALTTTVKAAGFHLVTARTHEMNVIYDLPGNVLGGRGALLRLRQYGEKWTLTFKDKSASAGRHKARPEIETRVENGLAMGHILECLGLKPKFSYEKYRTEWSDHHGHVVLDETPVGNFGEIEGEPDWIDHVAAKLGISEQQYIKSSYSELFREWKRKTRSQAHNMLFAETTSPHAP